MFEFHTDKERYFQIQYENTKDWVIPYINRFVTLDQNISVLEVGCAEGGVLKPFLELGCNCVGVELDPERAKLAERFLNKDFNEKIKIYSTDIYDESFLELFHNKFDLIILKDVIEHIHNQDKVINFFKKILKKNGKIFFGFPPWHMPFGGHQQICSNKYLSKTPWIHLLPSKIYKYVLDFFKENSECFMEIKHTGITTRRFEKILKKENYKILKKQFYFINPIYIYKFNIKGRLQNKLLAKIPFLNDFISTCVFYIVEKGTSND